MSFVLLWHARIGWLVLVPAFYMAITGIVAGLSDQIERMIEPHVFSVEPVPDQALSREEIIQQVTTLLGDVPFTILPRKAIFDSWEVHYGQRVLWLNPHTAEVLADRSVADRPSTIIKALHTGDIFAWRGFSAYASVAVLLVVLLGFVGRRGYCKGHRYWHIQLGIIALPIVALLTLSGLVMSFGFLHTGWLYDLHTGKYTILRVIFIASLLVFIFSLLSLIFTGYRK